MTTVLAFLQCQWFKDPQRVQEIYDRNPDLRAALNKKFLAGSLTGRRLQDAFGPVLFEQIIWEETSRQLGNKSSATFPADPEHIRSVIAAHKPDIILTFGNLATNAINAWVTEKLSAYMPEPLPIIISGPHPAARYYNIQNDLFEMAQTLIHRMQEVFNVDVYGKYDYDKSKYYESVEQNCVSV